MQDILPIELYLLYLTQYDRPGILKAYAIRLRYAVFLHRAAWQVDTIKPYIGSY